MIHARSLSRLMGRLSVRFTVLTGGMLVVLALVLALFNTLGSRWALWREMEASVVALSRFSAILVDDDLQNIRLNKISGLLQQFSTLDDITEARLLDKYRRVVADAAGRFVPFSAVSKDDLFDEAVRSRTIAMKVEGATYDVAQPVLQNGQVIGVLRFRTSISRMQAWNAAILRENAAIVMLFLLIAVPLTALLTHRATARVRVLTDVSRNIADGKLDTAIDTSGEGEMADLSRSMARMVKSLSENAAEIRALTFSDQLTGLPNRAQLQLRLETALEGMTDPVDRVALLLVDIVRFQRVNDALGQDRGDLLLRSFAIRLSEAVEDWREAEARTDGAAFEAVATRLSADEFGIMLAGGLTERDLDAVVRRIMRGVAEPFELDGHVLDLSVCIGIAIAPNDGYSFATLMDNAGIALQSAKKAGRGTHRYFAPELDERAYRRLVLESDLRQALERDQFEVFFQPQVTCSDGRAIGAEALVRWRHPERGVVSPAEFIPIAEESGLIVEIGARVIRQVCEHGARWAERGIAPRLSLNVSAVQFHQPDFSREVLQAILDTGVDPRLIELEVTESVAMGDPATVASLMAPLREAGVRFAIDDFGTGYSSLSTLTRLPFDVLKIDRSFVTEIDLGDPERRVLLATMIGMAKGLGLDVIAEGVERVEEWSFLKDFECTHAQGYLFARPMPAAVFEPWFIAHRRHNARLLQGRLREALAGLPRAAHL